jgi:alpha-1,3-rhamnosyl/mannosyltransferase
MGRAEQRGVAGRVRFLGHVPGGAIPALYRRAEALVFPSLYEGFGAPPLEAMACGCVVAASTGGALPEVCGDAAVLFDPRDTAAMAAGIDAVLSDRALRVRLRAAGLERVRIHSWDETVEHHNRVYAQAIAMRG